MKPFLPNRPRYRLGELRPGEFFHVSADGVRESFTGQVLRAGVYQNFATGELVTLPGTLSVLSARLIHPEFEVGVERSDAT